MVLPSQANICIYYLSYRDENYNISYMPWQSNRVFTSTTLQKNTSCIKRRSKWPAIHRLYMSCRKRMQRQSNEPPSTNTALQTAENACTVQQSSGRLCQMMQEISLSTTQHEFIIQILESPKGCEIVYVLTYSKKPSLTKGLCSVIQDYKARHCHQLPLTQSDPSSNFACYMF